MMDCTEWDEPAGSPKDAVEAMDIDFTEDLRQMRGSHYDKETLAMVGIVENPKKLVNALARMLC